MKKKATNALKSQIEKNAEALKKATIASAELKEEVSQLAHVMQKCASLMKRRQAEAKLIAKFRKDEAKKEAAKAKAKAKKAKVKAKKTTSKKVSK